MKDQKRERVFKQKGEKEQIDYIFNRRTISKKVLKKRKLLKSQMTHFIQYNVSVQNAI